MRKFLNLLFLCAVGIHFTYAQEKSLYQEISLTDLSAFTGLEANWQIAGSVDADLDTDYALTTEPGTGVLVNLPTDKAKSNLFTQMEHGDIDLELEFMMARHSNSGIYLQGRYEIQLLDSWGKTQPYFGDLGGVYQRWDESQPEGEKGFEGKAPRENAALAPGLWQKMVISFQAPRFNSKGVKIQNARILRLELNGRVLHENLDMTGPTRGSSFPEEASKGPLMIQGDHGPVAFRNIRYQSFDPLELTATSLSYEVYQGKFEELPVWDQVEVAYEGKLDKLSQEVVRENEKFIFRVKGEIDVPHSGPYTLYLGTSGHGTLLVDGKEIVPYGLWVRPGTIDLEKGTHNFEAIYHKRDAWYPNGLGLEIEGPFVRRQPLHALSSVPLDAPTNPIGIDLDREPRIVRCFIDYPEAGASREMRIVHAINVGFPSGISYTYDPDRANLALVWRGAFLDATPMWDNRGDGSSRPVGLSLPLGAEHTLGKLSSMEEAWGEKIDDTYKFVGYSLNSAGIPNFEYELAGVSISDQIMPMENSPAFSRTLSFSKNPAGTYYVRLASADKIKEISPQRFLVDQTYYIETSKGKAQIRTQGARQELLIPVEGLDKPVISYSIIW